MQKKKEEKGITLVILVVTIMLMTILTTTIAVNTKQHTEAKALTNLQNDLEVLKNRIKVKRDGSQEKPGRVFCCGDTAHAHSQAHQVRRPVGNGHQHAYRSRCGIRNVGQLLTGNLRLVSDAPHNRADKKRAEGIAEVDKDTKYPGHELGASAA